MANIKLFQVPGPDGPEVRAAVVGMEPGEALIDLASTLSEFLESESRILALADDHEISWL